MTIGPEPMIRMDLISVRFGIWGDAHNKVCPDSEAVKKSRVARAGGAYGPNARREEEAMLGHRGRRATKRAGRNRHQPGGLWAGRQHLLVAAPRRCHRIDSSLRLASAAVAHTT